jgi:two-component system NtrC family sensor kinase
MDKERSQKKNYRSLMRNAVLTILLTALAPTLVVSIFILNEFADSYQKKVHDHLTLLARKHKTIIDLFLEEKLMDIRFLASAYHFEELSNESVLNRKLIEIQQAHDRVFVDVGLVNSQGLQIAYAGPHNLTGARYADSEWFKIAINNSYFISDVFKGLRGTPHFIVSVRQEIDGKPWILRSTIDFGEFNTLVENLRIGESGFAYILNKKGEFQTSPIAEVNPGILINHFEKNDIFGRPNSILKLKNNNGKEVIYNVTSIKNSEWVMVFQQDYNDAFAELKVTQLIAVLIITVASLCIIASSFILSDRLIGRISLADEEKESADKEKEIMAQQVIETGKLASVGELAAGIAHEINNPVAIMIEEAGWIQDLLEEEDLKQSENLEEFYRSLKQINTQGRRCKDITHKLLSFARKTDSRVVQISINDLLNEIVHLSSQRAKYDNITIHTKLEKFLPTISASETEMQQVFLNLVNNAMDAMDKSGGSITLISKLVGNNLTVMVADNGAGIAEANLSRIFDPFYTTKPVGKGTGLGLSICFGIIKKLGGDIHVRSTKGKGTTFEVRIPVKKETEPPQEDALDVG